MAVCNKQSKHMKGGSEDRDWEKRSLFGTKKENI